VIGFTRRQEDTVQPLYIRWESRNDVALLGLIRSVDVEVKPTTSRFLEQLNHGMQSPPINAPVRDAAIRAMLRRGGFKPSGRNRPAQEYLSMAAIASAGLLSICNIVDINNYVSLKHRLPASIIDSTRVGLEDLLVREGFPGETYVFNSSGQELWLEGLLCLSTPDGIAVASPVKDAFASHVTEKTKSVIACVYGSVDLLSEAGMTVLVEEYSSLLEEYAGATTTDRLVVSAETIRRQSN
jgi:DNA/RNA-binding domain of Phe-tRNA-synthetase-like protein